MNVRDTLFGIIQETLSNPDILRISSQLMSRDDLRVLVGFHLARNRGLRAERWDLTDSPRSCSISLRWCSLPQRWKGARKWKEDWARLAILRYMYIEKKWNDTENLSENWRVRRDFKVLRLQPRRRLTFSDHVAYLIVLFKTLELVRKNKGPGDRDVLDINHLVFEARNRYHTEIGNDSNERSSRGWGSLPLVPYGNLTWPNSSMRIHPLRATLSLSLSYFMSPLFSHRLPFLSLFLPLPPPSLSLPSCSTLCRVSCERWARTGFDSFAPIEQVPHVLV